MPSLQRQSLCRNNLIESIFLNRTEHFLQPCYEFRSAQRYRPIRYSSRPVMAVKSIKIMLVLPQNRCILLNLPGTGGEGNRKSEKSIKIGQRKLVVIEKNKWM